MTEVKVQVESIRVEGRYRKELGDITKLAQSIARDGLIHAITVTPDNRLLAGERRLAAVKSLGWTLIDARVVDTLDDAAARLRIERDENTERKPMAPSELVALGLALEALERPRAAARKGHGTTAPGRQSNASDQQTGSVGETREIVAEALGISASSYERAKTVVAAANDPTSTEGERRIAKEAQADMDATGLISPAFHRVKAGISARTGAPKRTQIETAAAQRRSIGSAEAALSGICHGLNQITSLHPEITTEEAVRWADSLSDSRRVITALINRLKERTNAQPT